jgi:hypothetical protein
MRELAWMAEAKGRDNWRHTSMLCAVVVNSNPFRAKGAKPAKPSDFDPYRPEDKPLVVSIDALKVFVAPPQ